MSRRNKRLDYELVQLNQNEARVGSGAAKVGNVYADHSAIQLLCLF